MGLVVPEIVPIVSNPVIGTAIPVVSNSIVLTDNSSSDLFNIVGVADSSIYRMLSMQDNMKTFTIGGKLNSEFDLFMDMGNRLTSGTLDNANFIAFNEYLGTLGV